MYCSQHHRPRELWGPAANHISDNYYVQPSARHKAHTIHLRFTIQSSNTDMMIVRHTPCCQALNTVPRRVLASSVAVTAQSPSLSQRQSRRSFATVQDAAPRQKHHGGLKDQDRIFQNLYGHHGADLKSAMKYGDWHKTKEIILKGHEWVRMEQRVAFGRRRSRCSFADHL